MHQRHRDSFSSSAIQALESRRLLATLVVNGAAGADTIQVDRQGVQIVVTINGSVINYADSAYDSISVNGGEGADTIYLEATGANPTTLNGGAGTDTVLLGAGSHSMDSITASVVAIGGGVDSLRLDDGNAHQADEYNAFASGLITRGGGFGGVTATGFAETSIDAGDQADILRVYGTASTGTLRLLGGAGDDSFDVLSTDGATVIVDAGFGSDDLLDINRDGGTSASVSIIDTQILGSVLIYPNGTLNLVGNAGLLLATNQSDVSGVINIDRGFIIERNSFANDDGETYYRERLYNGLTNPTGQPRISSAFAAASAARDTLAYGYKQNIIPSTFGGFVLNTGDLLIRYDIQGDANLDGTTDFNDLLRLAANFNSGPGKRYTQGDFNYDGFVNFNDLLLLAAAFNQSVPVTSPSALPLAAAQTSTTPSKRDRSVSVIG